MATLVGVSPKHDWQVIGDRPMTKAQLAETYPVIAYNEYFPPEFVV